MLRTAAARGGATLRHFAVAGGAARSAFPAASASGSRSVSRAALPSAAGVAGNEALATDAAVRLVAGDVAPQQLTTYEAARFRADREAQKSIKNFTLNFGPQHPAGTCGAGREPRPHWMGPSRGYISWGDASLAAYDGFFSVAGCCCRMCVVSIAPRVFTSCAVDEGTHIATIVPTCTLACSMIGFFSFYCG